MTLDNGPLARMSMKVYRLYHEMYFREHAQNTRKDVSCIGHVQRYAIDEVWITMLNCD